MHKDLFHIIILLVIIDLKKKISEKLFYILFLIPYTIIWE